MIRHCWMSCLLALAASPLGAQVTTAPGTRLGRPPVTTPTRSTEPRLNPQNMGDMPAPAVQLRDAMPSSVTLTWNPLPDASGFLVFRNDAGQVTGAPLPPGTTSFLHGAANDYRLIYQYRVVAMYPNGHSGPSAWIPFQPPKPVNPTDFIATAQGSTVSLSWTAVPGVEQYLLGGDGLPIEGVRLPATTTRHEVPNLSIGLHEWTIASYYPNTVTTPASEWPRRSATVIEVSGPPANATSGRYRITLAGFVVNQEAPDDPLDFDGKHTEVFASAMVQLFDTTGAMSDTATTRTATHGEATKWPTRVPAGSGTDMGGLMTGDTVPAGWRPGQARDPAGPGRFPLLLWEGTLTNSKDVLVMRPQLWEEDGGPLYYNYYPNWAHETRSNWRFPSVRAAATGPNIQVVQGEVISKADADGSSGKIGTLGNGSRERLVVLTRQQIEANLTKTSNSGTPRGLLPVRFVDAGRFGEDDPSHGDYTLYLRVERVP